MAAGKGTRMRSKLPKVLHQLAGRALIRHVMTTAQRLSSRKLVIVTGHGAEQVEQALSNEVPAPRFVRQEPQLGTGHAVQQALPELTDDSVTLVLSGDVPLTEAATLEPLVEAARTGQLALLTVDTGDASGYGRVIRVGGRVQAIVEHKDANP